MAERVIQEDSPILPSPEFISRVMRAVRREAADREAIAFPWQRLWPGLALSVVLILGSVALGLTEVDPAPITSSTVTPRVVEAVQWLSLALAGSLALVWWSARLVTRP